MATRKEVQDLIEYSKYLLNTNDSVELAHPISIEYRNSENVNVVSISKNSTSRIFFVTDKGTNVNVFSCNLSQTFNTLVDYINEQIDKENDSEIEELSSLLFSWRGVSLSDFCASYGISIPKDVFSNSEISNWDNFRNNGTSLWVLRAAKKAVSTLENIKRLYTQYNDVDFDSLSTDEKVEAALLKTYQGVPNARHLYALWFNAQRFNSQYPVWNDFSETELPTLINVLKENHYASVVLATTSTSLMNELHHLLHLGYKVESTLRLTQHNDDSFIYQALLLHNENYE